MDQPWNPEFLRVLNIFPSNVEIVRVTGKMRGKMRVSLSPFHTSL